MTTNPSCDICATVTQAEGLCSGCTMAHGHAGAPKLISLADRSAFALWALVRPALTLTPDVRTALADVADAFDFGAAVDHANDIAPVAAGANPDVSWRWVDPGVRRALAAAVGDAVTGVQAARTEASREVVRKRQDRAAAQAAQWLGVR